MRRDPRKRYSTTPSFEFPEGAPVLFRGLMPRAVTRKTPFVEHEVQLGDRLDALAEAYYGDPRHWWVIAQANPEVFFAADLVYGPPAPADGLTSFRAGARIFIPAKPEEPV